MPLINTFCQRKAPRRRNVAGNALREKPEEEPAPQGSIILNLGSIITNFQDGQWIPQTSSWEEARMENALLKMQMSSLAESSNLLRLKNDVLVDMGDKRDYNEEKESGDGIDKAITLVCDNVSPRANRMKSDMRTCWRSSLKVWRRRLGGPNRRLRMKVCKKGLNKILIPASKRQS